MVKLIYGVIVGALIYTLSKFMNKKLRKVDDVMDKINKHNNNQKRTYSMKYYGQIDQKTKTTFQMGVVVSKNRKEIHK